MMQSRMRTRCGGVALAATCCASFLVILIGSGTHSNGNGAFSSPALRGASSSGASSSTALGVIVAPPPSAEPVAAASSDSHPTSLVTGFFAIVACCAAVRRRAVLTAAAPTNAVRGSATSRQATIMFEPEVDEEEDVDVIGRLTENASMVSKTSVLVLGATGTLGRQVVRQFLNAGYSVRCMVRNRADRPFSFLVDWGAQVIEGNLVRKETLPSALIGVHTVIDCATANPEENTYNVDWEGKKTFIQCCEKMDIQRYVFLSIKDCEKYQSVPLMQIKHLTEKLLAKSSLRYTVIRATGFMQPLVSQYAVSILDDQKVYGDDGTSPGIAYMDSQDCARFIAAAATKERTVGKTITVSGPKVWSTSEVIELCEKLSGRKADISTVPSAVLQLTQIVAGCFEFTIDVAERLRFVDVNSQNAGGKTEVMNRETYDILGVDPDNTRKLEDYIGEYYRRVFKKLTKGKYEPEAGELEKEKEDEENKLQRAIRAIQEDALPPGQPAERDVTILSQRDMSDRLQKLFEDKKLAWLEGRENKWFGWTNVAEVVNGRSAMMGVGLGLFTEWATEVSMSKQIDTLLAIFSSPS